MGKRDTTVHMDRDDLEEAVGEALSKVLDQVTEAVMEAVGNRTEGGYEPSLSEVQDAIAENSWTIDDLGIDLSDIDPDDIVSAVGTSTLLDACTRQDGEYETAQQLFDNMSGPQYVAEAVQKHLSVRRYVAWAIENEQLDDAEKAELVAMLGGGASVDEAKLRAEVRAEVEREVQAKLVACLFGKQEGV